jgi:hypothetical protein
MVLSFTRSVLVCCPSDQDVQKMTNVPISLR